MSLIALTGAGGFLGKALVNKLSANGLLGNAFNRRDTFLPVGFNDYLVPAINSLTDYKTGLQGVKCVIHCAARAHVMEDESIDSLVDFREINTYGTLNLARQAASAGVKRFIFISSIKVNGESTLNGAKFTSADKAMPEDPYGVSKAEAEAGLFTIADETGMEVVIIRPPIVYGPGVKGNFLKLLEISNRNIPLPFALVKNKRSMVYIENLVDLIITCVDNPNAANKVFLASDGDDLSLEKLFILLKTSMNRSTFQIPVPIFLFKFLGKIASKQAVVDRLVGDLQIDSSDLKKYLNWTAPYSVEQGIKATVNDFIKKTTK